MADIDQIIAGGAKTNANFDFSGILDSFYKGRDQKYQQEGRDLFKGGVPTDANGQPDFAAMGKALFQHGDIGQGTAVSNVGIQRDQLQQGQNFGQFMATGQYPQTSPQQPASTIVSPPSLSSNARTSVAPPLNRGGVNNAGSPQGDQPGSIVGLVSSAGIPDELAGPVIQQVSAMTKTDPNAALDPSVAPRVQQVVQALAQRMKGGQPQQPAGLAPQGVPQPQQGAPQPQPQPMPAPQAVTPQAPQSPPNPFANAIAQGLIPPGVDPRRYVAITTYAATVPGPQQKAAQERLAAINKASELTSEQKDYSAAQANPGLNDFTTQKAADTALATGIAASNVKQQDQVIADGQAGQKRLTTLNAITGIVNSEPNISLGFGAGNILKIKMALESMGVPKSMIGDLSGPQAIQKLNAALAAESTKGITSRPSQFEFKTFLANNPGLSLDRDGLLRVAGITAQLAKRDYDLGQLAADNRYNWDKWNTIVKTYDKNNPIKDPTTGNAITTNSVIAPGPAKASGPARPALEPGKTMINGHVYKGGNPNLKSSWELQS